MNNKYNYSNFSSSDYNFDGFDGPKQGEKVLDFKAKTLDGKEVKLSDYFGKPLVLEMGSFTCPVYAGMVSKMKKIRDDFPEIEFLVLYVREAHPGERRGAHKSLEEKIKNAQESCDYYKEDRTVLVDGIDGEAHRKYGSFPNSVYVINEMGTVVWRAKWNRSKELRKALSALLAGGEVPRELDVETPGALRLSALFKGGFVAVKDFVLGIPSLIWKKFILK
ncbi:MAG: deiodinase-like protein [Candidatus Paceibacterota bacterium]